MSKNRVKLSLAARCNAAGRPNNEDNFQISSDLAAGKWQFVANEVFEMGEKGVLLVACDGMGGMNAGEVASEIAVETIKSVFASENLTDDVLSSDSTIKRFVTNAIQTADAEIKRHAKENPETSGMGSTIVLIWLYDGKVYVGWCGDSRAYRFNAQSGLERLSHDHSYVQELVDAGKLSEELAFDHPNSNIITRSLGDPNGKAKPDVKVYDICDGDIYLLCSDGLCGTLRDEEICGIIAENTESMQQCCDALWIADEQAGWTDNVTTILAKVESGSAKTAKACPPSNSNSTPKVKKFSTNELKLKAKVRVLMIALIAILVLGGAVAAYFVLRNNDEAPKKDGVIEKVAQETEETESPGVEEDDEGDDEDVEQKPAVTEEKKVAPKEKCKIVGVTCCKLDDTIPIEEEGGWFVVDYRSTEYEFKFDVRGEGDLKFFDPVRNPKMENPKEGDENMASSTKRNRSVFIKLHQNDTDKNVTIEFKVAYGDAERMIKIRQKAKPKQGSSVK